MAFLDVYEARDHGGLWLDCQANRLSHLSHRFVVPLVESQDAPRPLVSGLNPELLVRETRHVMLTQFAGAVPVEELGRRVATLTDKDHRIVHAIDTLIGAA